MAPSIVVLNAIEVRLRGILAPYEGRLEPATIYGIPTLRRPGAKGHEWFAFVKPQAKFVSFYLMPLHTNGALRASLSPALAKRLSGRTAFNFPAPDDALFTELEAVVARAYDVYLAEGEAAEGEAAEGEAAEGPEATGG
jgi:hypothetical protein